MDVYEFGPFELDVERLLLLEQGEPVSLGPKVVETLLALVEHPGEVLSKSMLLDRIWPEGFVEEANLAQNIYVLRKMFRAHWASDAIETVPRRGYRFVAPVTRSQRGALAEAPVVAPEPVVAAAPAPRFSPRWQRYAFGAVAAILLGTMGIGAAFVPQSAPSVSRLSASGERLYQIGRYYWNLRTRDGVKRSMNYFAQVIDSDPKAPQGYAGLADANAMMGDYGYGGAKPDVYFERAAGYAKKALAVDPASAEAHAALGLIAMDKDHRAEAMRELQEAIKLDPACGPAREWLGVALVERGDVAQGYAQLKMAADLDPLSVATTAWLGQAAYFQHHFTDAIAYSRQALELSPQRSDAWAIIGDTYEVEGNVTRAIAAYRRYGAADPENRPEAAALLAHAYALGHRMNEALAELKYAQAHAKDVFPFDLAIAAAATGQRSAALGALKNVHSRNLWTAIARDPRFDVLRRDEAFRKLSQEVG